MNTFSIEKSVKERIEKVVFENGKVYKLLDNYDDGDGGVIIRILDKEELKKYYTDDDVFYDTFDNEVKFDRVVCSLWIEEGNNEGYQVCYTKEGIMLI